MLDGIQQWFHQNAPWLDPLGSLIAVLTGILTVIAFLFFKPLLWAVPKLWSSLSRSLKTGAKRPRFIIGFVADGLPE
jgi:hypothetical protein